MGDFAAHHLRYRILEASDSETDARSDSARLITGIAINIADLVTVASSEIALRREATLTDLARQC